MTSNVPEEAVRRYLEYLRDPSSIVDHDMVKSLAARLDEATDVVERIMLRQQLEQARAGDEAAVREAFVAHAKAWADVQGIAGSAFRAEGVPDHVLAEAGLVRRGAAEPRPPRRPAADAVREALPRRKDEAVTVSALAAHTGASVDTVRSVIKQEIAAGRLKVAGADPHHCRPGRPPTLYVQGP